MQALEEYLVALGFEVKTTELRKFTDALRNLASTVEQYTTMPHTGIGPMFLKAGAAISGVLSAAAVGTISLMDSVSRTDLNMQLLARRMFTTTEVARSLTNATDALGVSLEDIILGPPELRERFGAMMNLQNRMTGMLGSDWELQMKKIRDVKFEVQSLGLEFKYLGMAVVGDLARTILGDGKVRQDIKDFNEKLLQNIPAIANLISNTLSPVLEGMGKAAEKFVNYMTDPVNVAAWKIALDDVNARLQITYNFAKSLIKDPAGTLQNLTGEPTGNFAPSPSGVKDPKAKADILALYETWAVDAARVAGIDPNLWKAIVKRESSWNPNALNPTSGARGFSQLMPFNMSLYGMSGSNPQDNIQMGALLFAEKLKDFRGNIPLALEAYGGFASKKKITEEFPGYFNDIQRFYKGYGGGEAFKNFPPIQVTVNVNGSNADPKQIGQEVGKSVNEQIMMQSVLRQIQNGGPY